MPMWGMPVWERFRELCQLQFGPPVQGTRLAELARLPFQSTVQEYAQRYNAVLCHAHDLSLRQKVELFVGGLPSTSRWMWRSEIRPTFRRLSTWRGPSSAAWRLFCRPRSRTGTVLPASHAPLRHLQRGLQCRLRQQPRLP